MRTLDLLWVVVLLAPPAAPPKVEVAAADGRLTIRATRAPLADVLDEVARKSGMQVVFQSARPRQPVTVDIQSLPEEVAIARLLEGQPVSWAVKLSENRRRVERLVLADPSPPAAARRDSKAEVPPPRLPAEASTPSEPEVAPAPAATPRPTPSPTATPAAKPTRSPRATPKPTPTPTPRPPTR